MKIEKIENAKWNNVEKTSFDAMITFEEIGKPIPFTFNDFDLEDHSLWIKESWLPENMGLIGDYLPPSQHDIDARKAAEVRLQRDTLLLQSDVNVLPDRWYLMSDDEKALWANYREALRDIPKQLGFPHEVVWPLKPV